MIVLALDSTTPQGSVGLSLPDGTVDVRAGDSSRGWSERLPGLLTDLLQSRSLDISEVGVFAVCAGPGSLTGLRVGIATVQGLALATGRPLVAVSALEALAWHGRAQAVARATEPGHALRVGAWADALRGEVFSALYAWPFRGMAPDTSMRVLEDASVGPPEKTAARWGQVTESLPLMVVGDVGGLFGDILRRALGPGVDLVARPLLAGYVATLARRRVAQGEAGTPHAVRPLYVRKPDAVRARERVTAQNAADKERS